MPANYDEKAGSWTAQFYYTDYTGTRKKKFKRGFKLKKDALEWERVFLEKQQADINMSFKSFVELYFEDMRHRLRASTVDNKRYIVDLKITPFFSQMQLSQIKAADVRRWQNEMISVINDRTGLQPFLTMRSSIMTLKKIPAIKRAVWAKKRLTRWKYGHTKNLNVLSLLLRIAHSPGLLLKCCTLQDCGSVSLWP